MRITTRSADGASRYCMIGAAMGAAIVTSPLWFPLLTAAYGFKKLSRNRRRKLNRLPPKPIHRKRSLSMTGDAKPATSARSPRTDSQTQSLLFKLPLELRLAIYEEVVGKADIHIVHWQDKLHSFRCVNPGTHYRQNGKDHCWITDVTHRPVTPAGRTTLTRLHNPGIDVVPLLQSCRAIYLDLIEILYTKPTFLFQDSLSMFAFSASILPRRFDSIRSIHFHIKLSYYDNDPDWPLHPIVYNRATYHALRSRTVRNSPFPVLARQKEAKNLEVDLPGSTRYRERFPLLLGAPSYITDWELLCNVLDRMKGLKRLRIDLDYFSIQNSIVQRRHDHSAWDVETEMNISMPLESLAGRQLADFEVCFSADSFMAESMAYWAEFPFVKLYKDEKDEDLNL